MSSYRQAGTVLAIRTFSVPLDHDARRGERSRSSPGRWSRPTGLRRAALAALLQGGPGSAPRARTAATAGSAARSTTPGAAARPAGHRPVHPGHQADAGRSARRRAGPATSPQFPGRRDRARRGTGPPGGHRRRAVERARQSYGGSARDVPLLAPGASARPSSRRAARLDVTPTMSPDHYRQGQGQDPWCFFVLFFIAPRTNER